MALKVTIHNKKGFRYAQEIIAGRHRLTADRIELDGGDDSGPGPYSYLLAALGS
ncbi:OsmC family protein [Desulfospira joergensenii]|uniref:OsmC family protein n=1 Tax=Desulfospira joergensenii TaxID=53329 RepID=UPI0003F73553|nr:hypothetical protein [Desulfospira joergensenii]